jgi:hypothetical protein
MLASEFLYEVAYEAQKVKTAHEQQLNSLQPPPPIVAVAASDDPRHAPAGSQAGAAGAGAARAIVAASAPSAALVRPLPTELRAWVGFFVLFLFSCLLFSVIQIIY